MNKERNIIEEEDDIEEDEENDENSVMLSCAYKKGRLGVAYFIKSTGEFGIGETQETPNFDSLGYIKFKINPTVTLITYNAEFNFIKAVKKSSDEEEEREENVKMLKSRDFSKENGQNKLSLLKKVISTREEDVDDENEVKEVKEESQFNTDNWSISGVNFQNQEQMLRAAGALISYIQSLKFELGSLNEVDVLKIITQIYQISFEGFMQIDMNTIKALSIFKTEKHPCSTMKIGCSKEGISLFGIFDKTKTKMGKSLLRQWFQNPIVDMDELTKRLETIEYFFNAERNKLIDNLRKDLKNVKDLSRIIKRFTQQKFHPNDWMNLYRSLFFFKKIFERVIQEDNSPGNSPLQSKEKRQFSIDLIKYIEESYSDNVFQVINVISSVFDLQESKEMGRMIILEGIDEELDKQKEIYASLDHLLTLVAEQEISELPDDFPYEISVAYFPQLGYLIVMKRDKELENPILDVEGYTYFFMSDDFVYYKNDRMKEMDENIGDIHEKIIDRESLIESQIAEKICSVKDELINVSTVCGELDCLLSLTVVAKENGYSKPKLTQENVLIIKEGRNPIQEKCVSAFISNDTKINEKENRVHIITGPNMSGKSVYLKQVGLIVFLAHVGSFVPATEATIGLTDRILTRIYTDESVTQRYSTFAQDILRMNTILTTSTKNSLILVDEFGKGTLALDGLSLLASSLNHFIEKEDCPKIFVTTHYTELFEYKLIDLENRRFQFNTMNVFIEKKIESKVGKFDPQNVVFLYKLSKGKVMPSYGLICGAMAKIPQEILIRAEKISESFKKNIPIKAMEGNKSREKKRKFLHMIELLKKTNLDNEEQVKELISFIKNS